MEGMTAAFHRFVTARLDAYLRAPEMWGSNQAIEMSALTLMEAEVQHYCPEALENNPRVILDAYCEAIQERIGQTNVYLSSHVEDLKEFTKALYEVCHKVRYEIGSLLTIWGVGGKATYLFPPWPRRTEPKIPEDANVPEMSPEEKAELIARINGE